MTTRLIELAMNLGGEKMDNYCMIVAILNIKSF